MEPARIVALVGFAAPYVESFLAVAEAEGWEAVPSPGAVRLSELARSRPGAVVLELALPGRELVILVAEPSLAFDISETSTARPRDTLGVA